MDLKIISAGAGSGKTFRLTTELVNLLTQKTGIRAKGIIATTFTNKAAAELKERVRVSLLEKGMLEEAAELSNALIGTVHNLGVNLLKRFAFEAGVSPKVDILAEEDQQVMFNQSLSVVLNLEVVSKMEALADRLGLNKRGNYDWRNEVKGITEVARANNFSTSMLQESARLSFESLQKILGKPIGDSSIVLHNALEPLLQETIIKLESNEDETQKTKNVAILLKGLQFELQKRNELYWYNWLKISKQQVGAKSRDDFEPLAEFANSHQSCPDFQSDIEQFIAGLFELAIKAVDEFDRYKKERGLIDFTDMESLVNDLLNRADVVEVLAKEVDLLMVDEFQDTSPIQLEIFLKLSKIADQSIWVGDPKQSIYGFRGADPALMEAIISKVGGVQKENILTRSWRSRADLVHLSNAIFSKAFQDIPDEQITLIPQQSKEAESEKLTDALKHWYMAPVEEVKRAYGAPWFERSIAESLKAELERGLYFVPKGEKNPRLAKPADVAILCRSNAKCLVMAEALHKSGLDAAISRKGLLETAEVRLVLACLRYVLNPKDALSKAEILKLAANWQLEEILEDRLAYLYNEDASISKPWADDNEFILKLNKLRSRIVDLSGTELLGLIVEKLELRNTVCRWGRVDQRLSNIDALEKFAIEYETTCNRLHMAASVSGLLLWLDELSSNDKDDQGSGEHEGAVNVLTYHKSKGLEYPITICHDMESPLKGSVFGKSIQSMRDDVDLENLLGDRWIRYWINPYGDQKTGAGFFEKIKESEESIAAKKIAWLEEARLLYVGITRARNYLILPSRFKKKTIWLNRVCNHDESYQILDHNIPESPWTWKDNIVPMETKVFEYPKDFQNTLIQDPSRYILEPLGSESQLLSYNIDLNEDWVLQIAKNIKVGAIQRYAPEIVLQDNEFDVFYSAFNSYCLSHEATYALELKKEILQSICRRFQLSDATDSFRLLKQVDAFYQYLNGKFSNYKIEKSDIIEYEFETRKFKAKIDFLLVSAHEIMVVQNIKFQGEETELASNAASWKSWSALVKKTIMAHSNVGNVRVYLNYLIQGVLIPVEMN